MVRASGHGPSCQVTTCTYEEPCNTGPKPCARSNTLSIMFSSPLGSPGPPWTGMRRPPASVFWTSPTRASSATPAAWRSAIASLSAAITPLRVASNSPGVRSGALGVEQSRRPQRVARVERPRPPRIGLVALGEVVPEAAEQDGAAEVEILAQVPAREHLAGVVHRHGGALGRGCDASGQRATGGDHGVPGQLRRVRAIAEDEPLHVRPREAGRPEAVTAVDARLGHQQPGARAQGARGALVAHDAREPLERAMRVHEPVRVVRVGHVVPPEQMRLTAGREPPT